MKLSAGMVNLVRNSYQCTQLMLLSPLEKSGKLMWSGNWSPWHIRL